MAQRLVRVSCPHCAQEAIPTADEVAALGVGLPLLPEGCSFRRGAGCPKCRNTGYAGRTGIFEMLEVDEPMRALILHGAQGPELFAAARQRGMRTLRESGALKLASGVTTVDEILRVT